MNKVILLGRITKEIELIDVKPELKIAKFSLAVRSTKATEDSNFFDVVAFGKQAEMLATTVKKGQRILVEGSLRQEKFTDKTGANRSKVVVILNGFSYIEKREEVAEDDVKFDF